MLNEAFQVFLLAKIQWTGLKIRRAEPDMRPGLCGNSIRFARNHDTELASDNLLQDFSEGYFISDVLGWAVFL